MQFQWSLPLQVTWLRLVLYRRKCRYQRLEVMPILFGKPLKQLRRYHLLTFSASETNRLRHIIKNIAARRWDTSPYIVLIKAKTKQYPINMNKIAYKSNKKHPFNTYYYRKAPGCLS